MLTLLGCLVAALLVWIEHTGGMTYMWWMLLLPIYIGTALDVMLVGFLYWYNEIRKRDPSDHR